MTTDRPSLRARQAQLTKDEILAAARRLFAESGYSRTSVRDIAEAAGVSAQTVYDSIGSKQAIVARLNDLIDEESGVAEIAERSAGSLDPEVLVSVQAAIVRSILEHCGDIVRALVSGAAAEPELALVLREGHRRHVGGARRIVEQLQDLDALDPALTVDAAVDTLAASSDVTFALLLEDQYGWSLERIESWIVSTHRSLLLRSH
jgi:AcrR family transcriptional regulator